MFLRPEPELGWLPTHVQVTILQARGLRCKGKHGTSDAYTLIQVGREKYSTSVVEKTPGAPEWKEECSFELSPGAMERGESCQLQLTVMHRALIGMDQFLGQVGVPLQEVYQEGRSQKNQWYQLHSKPGKKEKARGEIQVSIQFTRNNLTASMFDLSIKDKPKTPFGKLKDKLKVKKLSQMESSSAIVPSSIGRLDSDDEDEKKPKSKAAAFFKGRLRKSSLTRSNTSLGSDSTISSASGSVPTSAGISIVLPDVVKKPASRNSSLSAEPTVKDHEASPRMTHKRAFSDEVSQLKLFPEPKSVQNLKPKGSPISRSSVCINGSHVYTEVPAPKPIPTLEKASPASRSFQNIVKKAEEVTEVILGTSHSTEKPEHKLTGPAPEEQKASLIPTPMTEPVWMETKPVQITTPMVFTEEVSKNKSQEAKTKDDKPKSGLDHGTGKKDPGNKSHNEPKPRVPASSEERGKVGSWFGSKDTKETQHKPSFPSGSIATSEAAERGSSLVEEHSPLASSCSTEDVNAFSNQGESGNFGDRPEFLSTQSSSSELPVVSGWEEQFDALASSRLLPSSRNYHQSPEPEDHNVSRKPLSSSFDKRETLTGKFIIPPKEDEWHNRQTSNSSFYSGWSELLSNDAKISCEPPSLPTCPLPNFPPTSIPFPDSAGLNLFVNLPTDTFSELKPFNHASQSVAMPVPSASENRVATVQPLVLTEQNMVCRGEGTRQDSSILRTAGMVPISGIDMHHTQVSKESVGQVSTEYHPERIDVEQDVLLDQMVAEIVKEEAINVDEGSVAPPKPPRLRLSSSFEQLEAEDYNYEQTSHQDTIGKQMENPEEHVQEQNMGVGKQTVSPAASCPVIEMESLALAAFTKDTQSTTEGLMTNLTDEDNDLGALNGEHLLDVNELMAKEQFRTCPSSVSLDLSSLHEGSDKLELIIRSPCQPLNISMADSKPSPDNFNFPKPMPRPKIEKGSGSEMSSQSKKWEQSDMFWSALEEKVPSHVIDLDTKVSVPPSQGSSARASVRNVSSLNYKQSFEPEQNKSEDVILKSVSPPSNQLDSDARALGHESQRGNSLSQQSPWSADIIVDFKNEDFWRTESNQSGRNRVQSLPSPGNPFSPADRMPLSHKNPFILEHSQSSRSSESSLQEDSSFSDLHARSALRDFSPAAAPPTDVKDPYLHGSQPLAYSTPSLATAPNSKPFNFPSPITLLTTPGTTTTTNTHTATLLGLHSPMAGGVTTAAPPILPLETQTADNPFIPLKISPHPVKPISAVLSEPSSDKKMQRPAITTALSSGLEMLKSVTGVQSVTPKKQEQERLKDLGFPDQAAKYYHLTHDELIQMLLQREAELCRKASHVRELEDYIDKLLVRIMDQAPALLQAPLETKK